MHNWFNWESINFRIEGLVVETLLEFALTLFEEMQSNLVGLLGNDNGVIDLLGMKI